MTHKAGSLRLLGALAASIAIVSGLSSPRTGDTSAAAGRYRSNTKRVAPGVALTHMVDRKGPNRISVLRVDLSRTTMDVALAKNSLPGLQTMRAIAKRRNALAAINGDYFFTHGHEWTGRPVNTYAEDGELKASPMIWGRNMAITPDESESLFGHFDLNVTVTEYDTGRTHAVKGWNAGPPRSERLAGFTPAGGSAITPPRDSCAVRLIPAGRRQWHPASEGVVQDLVVEESLCGAAPMERRGGVVIAGGFGSAGVLLAQSLLPGETVRLTWSVGFPKVLDTIGGNPLLMEDGHLAAGPCDSSSFCLRNPRTGAGLTADGKLLLVVVDGRWAKKSVGMTPAQFARLFRYLGATDAINLDGGGSSTMVVRGRVVNRPSDGYLRKVGNALLVLPYPDRDEPPMAASPPSTPTPFVTPTVIGSPSASASPSPSGSSLLDDLPLDDPPLGVLSSSLSACAAAEDPASIGGYLDHMLGRRETRVPGLSKTLSIFRGNRNIC